MIEKYIQDINKRYQLGNATEHTFRGDLQQLIENLVPTISATNEPKRQSCGAPDYILTKKDIPVGFIEAKDIGDKDLKGAKKTGNKEQFDRYKASLNNLIFTDYLDFHLYRDGEFITKIAIGEVTEKGIKSLPENFLTFTNLIRDFCTHIGQTIKSPKKLAEMMAGKARLLSGVIEKALMSDEINQENSTLKDQMGAFKKILIHDITPKEFADVYAQTIAYGMFAARLHDPILETFSRQKAAELIPKSNPFLRKLFGYIAGPDIDDRIKWIVDNLVEIFLACNVEEILKNYGKSTKMEDPIIHFYETFLSEYDPKLRKARGVWYTPAPVVNFIVRAVDDILKTEFDLPQGLADNSKTKIKVDVQGKLVEQEVHKVQILDPAAGTGTFLAEVIKHIHNKFAGQQGIWSNYVETHLLPRLNGFELLMASYAMAHLQLDLLLTETGYKPTTNQRFRVYLTNSLEEQHPDTGTLFASWLSAEANEANYIKRDTPVMCIIGNPPYSGESANKGEWIMSLMEDYKKEPGGKLKLNERNPKWINDDYVKFLRYGQHFIEKNGSGVLAFINPHGFLDNPTFRGMRWNLLKTYDKIYTIDLHGNSKKKETAPDGSADVNVFDIMQGVSINLFVKTGKKKANELGKLFHFDLYGKREMKYDFLSDNTLKTVPYKELPNIAPNYFFVSKDFDVQETYNNGIKITELFTLNNVGIVTARDGFTIHKTKFELQKTIEEFLSLDDETARIRFDLGKDVRDWQVNFAKKDLQNNYPNKGAIVNISYRPFDIRWTFYTGKSKGFHCYPRTEVMQHFAKGNVGIVYKLGNAEENSASAMVSKNIIDFRSWSRPGMQGGDYIAPLYLYPETNAQQIIGQTAERTPNLNTDIIKQIAEKLGLTFTNEKETTENTFAPIDILDYIYAVLHSPNYREKYKEFLKIDFPRVPYPKDQNTFWQLVKLGGEIRQIHLLESPTVEKYITQYPIDGDNIVTKPKYQDGKVYINNTQYFNFVPEIAWNFYIGGYQPAQKWLKDRKDRKLEIEDIFHYQKIIVALTETDRLMKEIDKIAIE
ncbi:MULTISPECIES: type ISP restriction/modification enzyme [Planktothrix]|uniref:site-specific DNA-methyltransferase (adenine-specific) n=1 Tax=Planktothrix rubescens CCAP 1459/22 TaxID=329571 RepID=A0A6J7ZNM9_PLARU|nr:MULTISPECIES: type ISP restriction/modification enzyme [Planktothrix]CAC5345359.1 Adenine specific DNA methyltransferase [Planktothrix rubescens NIVA-CYA 18]CAD5960104.1 Adenine specific DNA methyltransferase [Planktothrix rubescens NIVA-CYA 18]